MRCAAGLVLACTALAGCSGSRDGPAVSGTRTVVVAFYPLAWAVERVDAEVDVVNLTPPGGEPHDVELSPRDVDAVHDAALVVYVGGGFQPAVEEAVRDREGPSIDLLGPGERDPHVWLEPARFAAGVARIAAALGRPAAGRLVVHELRALDREYARALGTCERRTLVTAHAAFGGLAARYRLTSLSLTGTAPQAEPGPRRLQGLVEQVERSGVTTVFSEPLVSDRLAETVAREAGVELAVLDPIEGLSQERLDAGETYVSRMRENLEVLRGALACR